MNASDLLQKCHAAASAPPSIPVYGRVTQVLGTVIKAVVPGVRIGELCRLIPPQTNAEMAASAGKVQAASCMLSPGAETALLAEVVGFQQDTVLLTALGEMKGLSPETEVLPLHQGLCVPVGEAMLGHVVDGFGRPLDGKPPAFWAKMPHVPLETPPPLPLERRPVNVPLTLGIRALDTALTCAEGQRLGIFAAAGVGKSTLLAQIMRHTQAEIVVLALIGERGREVRAFVEEALGSAGLQRAVVVVATSDRPAMERIKAAYTATAIAETFRDRGRKVLLLMDSITRFVRAKREVGLAAGEPPVRRGLPPSVFAELPRLLERSGNGRRGSITALYTVLMEGEAEEDPVAEEVKSLLDGHIVLSSALAEKGHYPAIDVLRSVSRCQNAVLPEERRALVHRLRRLLAEYESVELLVKLGEYKAGSNALADEALAHIEAIEGFLRQAKGETSDAESAWRELEAVLT